MGQFANRATDLVAEYYINQVDNLIYDLVEENNDIPKKDIVVAVSELVEELIKEDLSQISAGYISELIFDSFDDIDYYALVDYVLK